MKRIIILRIVFLTVSALALSCSKEDALPFRTILTATNEDGATRTVLEDNGTSVLWEAGDKIKLFYGSSSSMFTAQCTKPSPTTTFTGSMNVVIGSGESGSQANTILGLYPYREDAAADGLSITTTLPDEQLGRAGAFAQGANISIGQSASMYMGFYNVCGGIRFSLTQQGIKTVVLRGNGGESLAGRIKLGMDGGLPVVKKVLEGKASITLSAPDGEVFAPGKWYYIVALPGVLAKGFELVFIKDGLQATVSSEKSVTIKRGVFGSLKDADSGLVFEDSPAVDLGLSVRWSSINVGATKPEEYGGYYAWGEVSTKTNYDWLTTYKWCYGGMNSTVSKYNSTSTSYGKLDNKTMLEADDDVAHALWGGSWRMPTDAEWKELIDNCSWTWTKKNGVNGYLVSGKNKNSIFIPAGGVKYNEDSTSIGSAGYYWSSSLSLTYPYYAWGVYFGSTFFNRDTDYRCDGRTIRPVTE